MTNKIEILSPGKNCWKTKKIISKLEKFAIAQNIDVKFVVVNDLKKILEYKTWILPTIIIKGKIVARGYKPDDKLIIENSEK